MQDILQRARTFLQKANGSGVPLVDELQIRAGDHTIALSLAQVDADKHLPRTAEAMTYSFNSGKPSPISSVYVDFSDYSRRLRIKGESPEQVDALFVSIRDEMLRHSLYLGGFGVKAAVHAVWFILGVASLILFMLWWQVRQARLLISAAIGVAVVGLLAFLPIDDLFAGFLVVDGDPGFAIRYGPQVGVLGLLVGVITPFLPLLPKIRSTSDAREATSDAERQYRLHEAEVIEVLSRRADIKPVRIESGRIDAVGDQLFDGVFEVSGRRIGVATFRSSLHSSSLRLFMVNAAHEVRQNHIAVVVIIFFKGARDEELRIAALEQLTVYHHTIRKAFVVRVVNPQRIETEVSNAFAPFTSNK